MHSNALPAEPAATCLAVPASKLFLAEGLGTFLLVLLGCGSVHTAVLLGAQVGLWQVAIVWGIAVMLAIYVVGPVSGAHINPAITLALAAWGKFSWHAVPLYLLAQLCGAMVAAGVLFAGFHSLIDAKEQQLQVRRGEAASVVTAMCYGEYYPNPGVLASRSDPISESDLAAHWGLVTQGVAFGVEVIGTAILALVVFAVTDPRNRDAPGANLAPAFIGLTIAALISVLAPLTQACFNPARDLGPRLFAYLAGWGSVALPGPNGIGFMTVYLVAPIVGAWLGAALYVRGIGSRLAMPEFETRLST